ncbi:hypothetical protein [Kineobactrum salinum]|uniref:Uncharacterized protein n=1 Tax=Kineobactrum salinum TaxID=2708301 RepID=A0A6C0U4X8_9GAMM|nr:hypothetical protein [Kineobactrum salinum]QIB67212.1 hypothetical protein G3T16_19180 [Kineobactrum salinum]
MNTYESLENLLAAAATTHAHAAAQYQQLQRRTENERILLLLEDACRREERLARLTLEFMERADSSLLSTRLQYTLEKEPIEYVNSLVPAGGPLRIDAVNEMGQQLYSYIEELLEGALRETAAASVQELLQELLQLEQAERRNFSLEMTSAGDV